MMVRNERHVVIEEEFVDCKKREAFCQGKKENRRRLEERKSIGWRGCKWNCQKEPELDAGVEDDVFLSTRLYTDGAKERVGDV